MKGKMYVIILVFIFCLSAGAIGVFAQSKLQVTMPTTILITQKLEAISNYELQNNSIKKGWLYVTDEKGKKVDVPIKISSKNTIEVSDLPAGKYMLHIDKLAIAKTKLLIKDQKFSFEVIDHLTTITSEKELKEYFSKIAKEEEKGNRNRIFEMAEEESSVADSSNSRHSTTNNQVEGIEEADVTVTDGKTIYTVSGANIYLIDASNAKKLKQSAVIRFDEYDYVEQLLLHENYLIVSYTDYDEYKENGMWMSKSYAKVAIYDVSNKAKPTLVRDYGHEGYTVAIRKTKDTLYFVTQNTPNYWIWYNENKDIDILKPVIYDSETGGEQLQPIEKITILPNSTEPNYTTISAIDLSSGQSVDIKTESYLGSSSGFYMSHNSIYLTAAKYSQPAGTNRIMTDMIIMEPTETSIYRFAVNGLTVSFAGQTTIDGSILNQFSMDEYNGYFRVAVTSGNTRGANVDSTSGIFVYDSAMNKVGEVKDLAKGERIYSARFTGDKAYIVTFKETDPLFTFDLSNPKNPKVLGELKIPGFSTYLHPIGENHLLGIGYETKVVENEGFSFIQRGGLKLSLFNVSDLNNPVEQDVEYIGGEGSYSQAIDNHKAMFIDAKKNLYGFPVTLYDYEKNPSKPYQGQGAVLYNVTAKNGITLAADLITPSGNEDYEEWEKLTQRIIYIGNVLYLVKSKEIVSYHYSTFEQLGTISFH